jgi:hypothetical protein
MGNSIPIAAHAEQEIKEVRSVIGQSSEMKQLIRAAF